MSYLLLLLLLFTPTFICQNDNPQIDINHKLPIDDAYKILLFILIGYIAGTIVTALCCCCYHHHQQRPYNENDYHPV